MSLRRTPLQLNEARAKKGRVLYHATTPESASEILRHGFRLPEKPEDVATHRFETPTISAANAPEHAAVYHPTTGHVLKITLHPDARILKRDLRQHGRRGENLEQTTNRLIGVAREKGHQVLDVGHGWQSTVGNQILDPSAIKSVEHHGPSSDFPR